MSEHGAGALVLIADDSVDNRDVYVMVLESRGYRVDVAYDGAEAIIKAVALCPAIIIMDLAMPIIDGWTACRRLKDDKRTAGIPVIVLSAHVMKGEEERRRRAATRICGNRACPRRWSPRSSGIWREWRCPRRTRDRKIETRVPMVVA
jgi:CheY-like chemotaxis protein